MSATLPRKPLVYLAVSLPLLVLGGIAAVAGLVATFAHSRGIALNRVGDGPGILLGLSALSLWIPSRCRWATASCAEPPHCAGARTATHAMAERRTTVRRSVYCCARRCIAAIALPVIVGVFLLAD